MGLNSDILPDEPYATMADNQRRLREHITISMLEVAQRSGHSHNEYNEETRWAAAT